MGKFMIYFPLTLATVLGSSLFVALIINSMLTSVFMKTEETKMEKKALIKISTGLLIFGVLLTLSGLLETNLIFSIIGPILLLMGLFMTITGWLNRNKTKRLKNGLSLFGLGILLSIICKAC